MLKRGSKSLLECHMSPEGETKHEATREGLKRESFLFIMGELCVRGDVKACSSPSLFVSGIDQP